MAETRILLAEDHTILRQGIHSLLATEPGLLVVGEAEDGLQAVAQARELRPDLVLIDLSMPLMNGTEAIRQIKLRDPSIRIIVLTVHNSDVHVRATLDAGAAGYLLKDDAHQDLLAAIRAVMAGGTYLSPKICAKVVSGFLGQPAPQTEGVVAWDTLTDREREVVKLVAEGYKNREIADWLSISTKTVEKHRANVMKKLGVHGASGLTAYAIQQGLTTK